MTISPYVPPAWLSSLPSGVWTYLSATIALTGSGAGGVQVSFGSNAGIGAGQSFGATNLQVETGAIATPFERRPIGHEMLLCQRYYEAISALSGSFYATGGGQGFPVYAKFAAYKRATPTISAPTTNSNCSTSVINKAQDQFAVQALSTAAGTLSFFTPSSITASAEL